MSNEIEPTSKEGPNAPKKWADLSTAEKAERIRAGKAKKAAERINVESKPAANDRDDLIQQMAAMAKQIENLQVAGKERFEAQAVRLDPIPPASETLQPGSLVTIGKDAAGSPIQAKVRWTREYIEKTSPPETFVPKRNMHVTVNGVSFDLVGGELNTVPGMVKGTYETVMAAEETEHARTRPLSPEEEARISHLAANAPGKFWSRLHRSGHTGLNVRTPEQPQAAEAPAPQETPAK